MQVQLRHNELQQPLRGQASRGGVTGSRRHRLLQDGSSQGLHLGRRFAALPRRYSWVSDRDRRGQVYLRGAEDDSAVVLSSAGSFLLLAAEADGHWAEALVDPEEVLVLYDKRCNADGLNATVHHCLCHLTKTQEQRSNAPFM